MSKSPHISISTLAGDLLIIASNRKLSLDFERALAAAAVMTGEAKATLAITETAPPPNFVAPNLPPPADGKSWPTARYQRTHRRRSLDRFLTEHWKPLHDAGIKLNTAIIGKVDPVLMKAIYSRYDGAKNAGKTAEFPFPIPYSQNFRNGKSGIEPPAGPA